MTTIFQQLIEILIGIDPNSDECVIFKHAERYYRMNDLEARVNSYAHHISYRLHHQRPPLLGPQVDGKSWCVAHKCDIKGCVNPRHLENVTADKNSQDAYARGLIDPEKKSRGVREGMARMSPEKRALKNHRISLARQRYEKKRARGVMLEAAKVWGVRERLHSVMDVIDKLEKKS